MGVIRSRMPTIHGLLDGLVHCGPVWAVQYPLLHLSLYWQPCTTLGRNLLPHMLLHKDRSSPPLSARWNLFKYFWLWSYCPPVFIKNPLYVKALIALKCHLKPTRYQLYNSETDSMNWILMNWMSLLCVMLNYLTFVKPSVCHSSSPWAPQGVLATV